MKKTRSALAAVLLLAAGPVWVNATNLSTYRAFKLGSDIATIAKQTGLDAASVKVVHTRPALIQELQWRPGYLAATEPDTVRDVVFTFYEGRLFRISATYDRNGTEGMTVGDLTAAISAAYGPAVQSDPAAVPRVERHTGDEEVVAQWEDALHRYDLIRSAYGPTFQLIGTQKTLEVPAQAAIAEATRLDDQEAPQREAARQVKDADAEASRLNKTRTANKPKFRL